MTFDLDGVRDLLDRRANPGSTHWEGCYVDHVDCAAAVLLAEVVRLTEVVHGDPSRRQVAARLGVPVEALEVESAVQRLVRYRDERDRLREALTRIANGDVDPWYDGWADHKNGQRAMRACARQALDGEGET